MKSGSTSFVIKEVLIKTTMTKPRAGRIWSEEAAYLVLVNINQYNHLGKQTIYTQVEDPMPFDQVVPL